MEVVFVTVSSSFLERCRARNWLSPALAGAVAGAGLIGGAAEGAQAQTVVTDAPSCLDPVLPNISAEASAAPRIWGRGGSAPNVLVGRLAVELQESNEPLVVIYKSDGACKALESLDSSTTQRVRLSSGDLQYWFRDANGKIVAQPCTLPTDGDPVLASWGSMAQLATTCSGYTALPNDISDNIGPISAFSLLVHKDSNEQAISAEAVYYIYGFGPEQYPIAPWTVPGAIGSRTTTSAAGLLLAKAVGIPLNRALYGSTTGTPLPYTNSKGSNDVVTNGNMVKFLVEGVKKGINAQATLGFASTETVDASRKDVKSLAFQAIGQEYAYWPDSDQSVALDKINVREGRYFLWNPHHFYAKLDGPNGKIADPNVQRWIDYLTHDKPLPQGKSFLDIQTEVGNIPHCAMNVTRDGDVGPLASFQPEVPCGCYFEDHAQKGVHSASCQACENQPGEELPNEAAHPSCPASAQYCRYGFCEVK